MTMSKMRSSLVTILILGESMEFIHRIIIVRSHSGACRGTSFQDHFSPRSVIREELSLAAYSTPVATTSS